MNGQNPIKVLSKCRHFLKEMNLGTTTKFRIGRWEIPYYLSCIFVSIPLVVLIFLNYCTAYDLGLNGFYGNENVFFVSLGCTQMLFIYVCLAKNNHLIVQIMDFFQKIVDRSKYIRSIYFLFHNYVFLFDQGSESSAQASIIYRMAETEHTERGEKFRKYSILFILICSLPPSIGPICYAIFRTPSPDQWQLPLSIKYD